MVRALPLPPTVFVEHETASISARKAPRHTDAEWEAVKDRLEELYLHDGLSLEKTQTTLAEEGFIATKPQLRRRLPKRVRVSRSAACTILGQYEKDEDFEPDPNNAFELQVQRYNQRNQIIRSLAAGRCKPLESNPLTPQPPCLTNEQRLLHDLRQYILSSFGSRAWKLVDDDRLIESSENTSIEKSDLKLLQRNMKLACRRTPASPAYLNQVLAEAETLVRGTYHDHIPNLIRLLTDLYQQGFSDFASTLQRQLSIYARAQSPTNNLKRAIFSRLSQVTHTEAQSLEAAIQTLFQSLFAQTLGSTPYSSFVMQKDNAARRLEQNPQAPFAEYLPDLADLDETFGPSTRRSMDVLWLRARIHKHRGEYTSAFQEAIELQRRAESCVDDVWLQVYYRLAALLLLGQLEVARNRGASAIGYFQEFLALKQRFSEMPAANEFGCESAVVIGMLSSLEREAGNIQASEYWRSREEEEDSFVGIWDSTIRA